MRKSIDNHIQKAESACQIFSQGLAEYDTREKEYSLYKILKILTLSFISKSLTIKVATKDFKGAANWSGASMAIWPIVTNGVMRCSKLLGSRLLCSG